jgi:hypothetical protein
MIGGQIKKGQAHIMFVKAMECGPAGNPRTKANPSWDDIEAEVWSLDGDRNDSIALDGAGTSYMGICGGGDDHYVVAGFLEGFGSFICASGQKDGSPIDVAVTGDFNTYPSKHVVDLDKAIAAAKVFCEQGVLSDRLRWDKERQ